MRGKRPVKRIRVKGYTRTMFNGKRVRVKSYLRRSN